MANKPNFEESRTELSLGSDDENIPHNKLGDVSNPILISSDSDTDIDNEPNIKIKINDKLSVEQGIKKDQFRIVIKPDDSNSDSVYSSERDDNDKDKSGSEHEFKHSRSSSEREDNDKSSSEHKFKQDRLTKVHIKDENSSSDSRSSSERESKFEPKGPRMKRKWSSSEQESSSDPDSGDSSEFPQSSSQTIIPGCTSEWTTDVLNSLQITLIRSSDFEPVDIIRDLIDMSEQMEEVTDSLKEHIVRYMPDGLKNLDFECVSEITTEHEVKLTSVDGSNSCWQFRKMQEVNQTFQQFFIDKYEMNTRYSVSMFGSMGEYFGRYLMFLASMHEQEKKISESMYQDLLQHFLQMFGLYCYTQPSIPRQTMKIKDVDVVSIPDLLLLKEKGLKIVAVCEVKNAVEDMCYPTPPDTRMGYAKRLKVKHLSDRLIGQSGGELLLHAKSSIFSKGILGMIVQKTNVTFTHLKLPERDAIDVIASGKYLDKNSKMIVKYSKPYNYLKAEDRMELIKPLLMLRFIYLGEKFLT